MSVQKADACTRAVYIGPDHMVVTGRTMDWKEDIMSNIYVFPRGIQRAGYNKENAVKWTSKYGSVIATGYDIGTCDGMNEKGLVASLLFLPESVFDRPGDTRPVMGISIWTQYVLDNFATVHEAVEELKKESFRIDAPHMPNGSASTLHLAITDETGNTAVLEYLDGNLSIHEGKEFQVMTNSPRYDYQLAINNYWKEVGGLQMLPGTNRSSDRFVRASFYIHAIPQTPDAKIAVPSVLSVMRNVSVPFGITTPDKPHISSTRWRSVSDQKNKIYYFESVMTPNLFWLDLKKIDFSPKAGIKKLTLTNARQRMLYGRTSSNRASRFLDEIPEENMEWLGKPEPRPTSSWDDFGDGPAYAPQREARPGTERPAHPERPVRPAAVSAPLLQLQPGDGVRHSAFGQGMVLSVRPMGGDALVEVAFDRVGTKRLMLKAAGAHLVKL